MISFDEQNRPPNFIGKNGKFFLVRCFDPIHGEEWKEIGLENHLPTVATGQCAWCGWNKEDAEK